MMGEEKNEKDQAVAITYTLRILPYFLACLTSFLKVRGLTSQTEMVREERKARSGMREGEMADVGIRARLSGALRHFSFALTSYLPLSNSLWVGNSWSLL